MVYFAPTRSLDSVRRRAALSCGGAARGGAAPVDPQSGAAVGRRRRARPDFPAAKILRLCSLNLVVCSRTPRLNRAMPTQRF